MHKQLVVTMAFSLICTAAFGIWRTSFAQDGGDKSAVAIVGGDESGFRELLPFIVSDSYSIAQGIKTTVQMGDTPEKMLFELPFPDGAKVVASVSYETNKQEKYYRPDTIYLETTLTPEEVMAFYDENLGDDFSQPANNYDGGGGFTPVITAVSQLYCYQKDKAMVNITATPDNGITRVTFELMELLNAPNTCTDNSAEYNMGGYEYLPKLTMPEGAELVNWEGGGGGSRAQSLATISSELDVATLSDAFEQQVIAEDWKISDSEGTDHWGWLTATKTDEDGNVWVVVLTLTPHPLEEKVYDATLMIYEGESK